MQRALPVLLRTGQKPNPSLMEILNDPDIPVLPYEQVKMQEMIGSGAQGIVWRGIREDTNQEVAIKQTHIGDITQVELAKEMKAASILAYPNTFEETSCITAIEAMAAGCVPITSSLGALPETIADAGCLIADKPGTVEFIENFVEKICYLFENKNELDKLAIAAMKR